MRNQEFVLLSEENVVDLLSNDSLNVPKEETIYHALVAWCNHDPLERKKQFSRLLSYVRLPLMEPRVHMVILLTLLAYFFIYTVNMIDL